VSAPIPDAVRRPLERLRQAARNLALRLLARVGPRGDAPLPDPASLRRVLLVCLNFRIGNTLVATPGVAALCAALPEARIDFLGGPAARAVFTGFPLRRIFALSRRQVFGPLPLLALLRTLRRERYDAAIHVSTSTGSFGAFLVGASGARHRIGVLRPGGNVFFTSTLAPPTSRHKLDRLGEVVAGLGIPVLRERVMFLGEEERTQAEAQLARALGEGHAPVVALFVGGRAYKGKALEARLFADVARGLREKGFAPLVFIGPDERARQAEIRREIGDALYLDEPDLRRVAALLSRCAAVLTPDAGPMHLAIAAGAYTVAVFRKPNHDRWGPRPPHGEVVYDPDGPDAKRVLEAVLRGARASRPASTAQEPPAN
jgi:heptosyltransferase-3